MLLFGIPAAIVAGVKGFKPLRWLLALGIFGLIVVACLASAKAKGISPEVSEARAIKADSIGALMAWINVGISVIIILIFLGNS